MAGKSRQGTARFVVFFCGEAGAVRYILSW